MNDPHNLQRFVDAQNPVYDRVCAELRAGQKMSHWMWFIFAQLRGLGRSHMADKLAISSREEALAYLKHPLLGERLRECTGLVNSVQGRTINEIFDYPDDLKFRSSMTLFAQVASGENIFHEAIRKYFHGGFDALTLERL